MTLQDGKLLIDGGVNATLNAHLPILNNLSWLDIMVFGMFCSVLGWFIARMIKGASHNEEAVQSEGEASNVYNSDEDMAYA